MRFTKILLSFLFSLYILSVLSTSVFATVTFWAGNNSVAPVNNVMLNFTWTNSTPISSANATLNITFTLPFGGVNVSYITGSATTNVSASSSLKNITANSSMVIFGNLTSLNDSSTVGANFTFNVSSTSAGFFTINVTESYNISNTVVLINSTINFNITNGTITLANMTFSNFTYNGNTAPMNFSATTTAATGGTVTDNITYNLYLNSALVATNFTGGTTGGAGVANFTANGTAQLYTFVFNTTGSNNYTAKSLTALLNISQATPVVTVYLNNATANQTATYPTSVEIRGNSTTSLNPPTFNLSVVNTSSSAVVLSVTGNPSVFNVPLGNGTYQIYYNTTANQNYTAASNRTLFVLVNQGSPTLNITLSPSSSVSYGTTTTATGNGCPTSGAADLTCTYQRAASGGITVNPSNPDVGNLNSGTTYTYTYSTGGGANWTSATTSAALSIGLSGGSGGGGGGSSTQNTGTFFNVIPPATNETITSQDLQSTGTDFTQIQFTVSNTANSVQFTVNGVSNEPSGLSSHLSTPIYHYIQITTQNLNDSNVASGTINFKVSTSWMNSNNVNPSSITLMRYVNGNWVALPTTLINSDSSYYYFQATTPGFSYFAITTFAATTTQTTTQTPTQTSTQISTLTTTQVPVQLPSVSNPAMGTNVMVAIVIVLFVVFALVLYLLKSKHKSHKLQT